MYWKERLSHERQQHGGRHNPAIILVHFNVGLRPDVYVGVFHSLSLGVSSTNYRALAGVPAAGGATAGLASASFFKSRSCRLSRTSTSSSRSRCAAGFSWILINGALRSGVACVTVASGKSFGNMRSWPEARTTSPADTFVSLLT